MIKKILFLCFITISIPGDENKKYSFKEIAEKVNKQEPMTIDEASFFFFMQSSISGKVGTFANIFWMASWVTQLLIHQVSTVTLPLVQKYMLKYTFKKQIKKLKKKYRLNNILGYDAQKALCQVIIDEMKEQKKLAQYRLPNGILFYGPSGCGKTNFVYTIASEAGMPLIKILAKDLINDDGTMTGKFDVLCDAIKEYVAKNGPCILFLEELDFLVANRKNGNLTDNKIIVLQNFLDKLGDEEYFGGCFVIACTNYIHLLDEALLRDQRIGRCIEIGKPTLEDISKFYDIYCTLNDSDKQAKKELILSECLGMSCAGLIEKFRHLS
jgi:SpoVK/Ycf46/Vps4 family AAA+-type ATPase